MRTKILVLIVFGIASVFILGGVLTDRTGLPELQLRFILLRQAWGILLSLLAAVLLLVRATAGSSLAQLLPLVLPLLAGLVIMEFHWATVVVLGTLGLAAMAQDWFRKEPPSRD